MPLSPLSEHHTSPFSLPTMARYILIALVALCYLLSTAQTARHFNIRLWRYDTEKPCHLPLHGLMTKKIRGDGHCQTFKTPMSSFEYAWLKHPSEHPSNEMPVDYGMCEIHLWEGKHCQGRSLGTIKDVSGKCHARSKITA